MGGEGLVAQEETWERTEQQGPEREIKGLSSSRAPKGSSRENNTGEHSRDDDAVGDVFDETDNDNRDIVIEKKSTGKKTKVANKKKTTTKKRASENTENVEVNNAEADNESGARRPAALPFGTPTPAPSSSTPRPLTSSHPLPLPPPIQLPSFSSTFAHAISPPRQVVRPPSPPPTLISERPTRALPKAKGRKGKGKSVESVEDVVPPVSVSMVLIKQPFKLALIQMSNYRLLQVPTKVKESLPTLPPPVTESPVLPAVSPQLHQAPELVLPSEKSEKMIIPPTMILSPTSLVLVMVRVGKKRSSRWWASLVLSRRRNLGLLGIIRREGSLSREELKGRIKGKRRRRLRYRRLLRGIC